MANPGGVGAKFVSVNLNKSYGQPSHHNYQHYNSGSYGPSGNRARPGSHTSAGGGGGGGMVVLSRNRPLQKVAPKLSVPPPLNLPSRRKEHEKQDPSGGAGGAAGGSGAGSGPRPSSAGMSWTKPGNVALQEKEDSDVSVVPEIVNDTNGVHKGGSTYMPPAARFVGGGLVHTDAASAHSYPPGVEKAMVLRGEDFPSLRAALPTSSGSSQKQKDAPSQKQKQLLVEESSVKQRDSSPVPMRPQGQSSHSVTNASSGKGGQSHRYDGGAQAGYQSQKQEIPLPLVRLNPRSDWADDERDTGHVFVDRSKDHGFPRTEAYWERDFDMPRSSILPHKPPKSTFERWSQRSDEAGRSSSNEVPKLDPYHRDASTPSREEREGNTWINSSLHKDGFSVQEVVNDRIDIGRQAGLCRGAVKDNKYTSTSFGDNARHGDASGNRDSSFGRKDTGNGQHVGKHWNQPVESISRGAERHVRDRYGVELSSRYRDEASLNSTASKSSFSSGGKGLPMNDPLLNFGREKCAFSKNERPYVEDPYSKDFGSSGYDERDPFSASLVGLVKRKKDMVKPADFHDPVRESFEAELERVQKMQEMERQRVIEEQERALEQARREEEERRRLIREEEERRIRLEDESREAAWRAEQERLDAIRKAEEQRIAREEEKRRIYYEEERRKQAARQKLLELEAKIAQRKTEVTKSEPFANTAADDEIPANRMDKDMATAVDLDNWEDSEKMVERITTSASSDLPTLNYSSFVDRGKPGNPWRRDAFENGSNSSFLIHEPENGHISLRRDAFDARVFQRREFYGEVGYMPSRTDFKGGMQESQPDGFAHHLREHRWNQSGDGDHYNKTRGVETEFYENIGEKYDDFGWGQGHSRGNTRPPYADRLYSESDDIYSYGRSRYSMRQPHVLPPPSLTPPVHKTSFRGENEHSAPSTSLQNDGPYNHHGARAGPTFRTGYYGDHKEDLEPPEPVDVRQGIETQRLDNNATPRCDSQSSLSVSSPPSSPTHLSHDELDDSAGSPVVCTAVELSGNNSDVLDDKHGNETMMKATNSISADDDDVWSLENDEEMQEQEEYDEDDDGYQEGDEVHEKDNENIDLTQEFQHMHLEGKSSSDVTDNLVLGFNEGVEVGMLGDEFERNSKSEKIKYEIPEISVSIMEEEKESFEGVQGDECLQQVLHEFEKEIEDSNTQRLDASHTSTSSDLLENTDASSGSGISVQCTVPCSVDMASQSSGQTIMSAVSSAPTQADLPVKLQFGLFSGPSLIPSPVPAIQIGSIQMPLHLHPQVGPSISHIHQSQLPLFQFGQFRYTSPVSQGILPMAPQSMSFAQPNIHAHYNLNQNCGGTVPSQPAPDTSTINMKKDVVPSFSVSNQPAIISTVPDPSGVNWSRGLRSFPVRGSAESNHLTPSSQTQVSNAANNRDMLKPGLQAEPKGHHDSAVKTYIPPSENKGSEGRLQNAPVTSQSGHGEKYFTSSKAPGPLPGSTGRRTAYPARNSGTRPSFPASEASRTDPSGGYQRRPRRAIQRTEFRVRENVDRRQTSAFDSPNRLGPDDKLNSNDKGVGTFARGGFRRGALLTKSSKQIFESESIITGTNSSQEISESRAGRGTARQSISRSLGISSSGEGNLKRNIPEEDVDAPLQSGIVRVFNQPGIEAPSDEDDFIEVRSKRQMLNDRRERREKEIKAKSRVTKLPRKTRSSVQSTVVSIGSNKISTSMGSQTSNNVHSDISSFEGRRGIVNKETSAGFPSMGSQQLSPIGTPAVNTDSQADIRCHTIKSLQTVPVAVISESGKDFGPSLRFESKTKVLDNAQSSVGAWDSAQIDHQVMSLTQTQLDEAMKPARFDTHVTSTGDHTTSVSEPILEISNSSSASPINSLLAGEKIQFGAVTSPTVLPPSSRIVSHGIGAPGSFRSDKKISQSLPKAENDRTLFFEKDEHPNESCALLKDCEAKAAASAVAAISTDEIVDNGLGSSVSDAKGSRGVDVDNITTGLAVDQQSGSQLRTDESLSVSLPADLSVENPPISLWPPLPSPQNLSAPMLSHFPGASPSHFPFYEMNHPMMGAPIFAIGSHEESGGTQSQSQNSTVTGSGHIGPWQHHSSVDSFYGPPAGFSGPFISPPGGIPGVQAAPHMVVYNHYAPVGQFGQVGLSFMGATYIPSGKQPDWKHNPSTSGMGISEGDMNAMNMVSAQRNPPNMPPPLQHLAPGSPLLPMASPLAMFDVSPFQNAPEISVQARWPHLPASSLHSVPISLPLQQHTEGAMPSQFGIHGHPVDQSLTPNRFSESRTSSPSDNNRGFPVVRDKTVAQIADELGLVKSSSSTISGTSTELAISQGSSGNIVVNPGKADGIPKGQAANAFKPQHPHPKNSSAQQYNQSGGGYRYQRGTSQKNNSGGEWSHRRMGFHGRNQSVGADRNLPSLKMKQIYVVKQTSSGPSSTVG